MAENGGRVDTISVVFNSESIEQSAQYPRDIGCSWDLETEIKKEGSESRVDEPEISQPVSCPLQIALVDLLDRIKLRPAIVLGHSSGEVAAAYCKGAISHLSAIKIAYYRGLGGTAASRDPIERSMMSARLSKADAIAALQEISIEAHDLHVACINSPTNVTTAEDDGHLNALKAILDQKGTFARKLKVSCAYHSPHMALVANEYFSRAGKIEPRVKGPTHQPIPMISDIDGDMVSDSRLQDSDDWIQNMCSAVRFTDNAKKIDKLASLAVSGPLREIMQKTFRFTRDTKYDSALIRGSSGQDSIPRAAGGPHSYGFDIGTDYPNGIDSRRVPQLVDLPCCPFSHNRTYWNENRRSHMRDSVLEGQTKFWVEDQNINDAVLYPGAGMLAMAIEAMNQLARETLDVILSAFSLKHIEFLAAIQIQAAPILLCQLVISQTETCFTKHCRILISPTGGCIQSSMVLQSVLFSDMTHDDWADVTPCKIAGSWNLHELLPNDLDFFILLSSVQAVFGARTKPIYNADNTYMDGLAHHRVSKGLKAVSIMLGLMTTDGYLAGADHRDEREFLLAQNTYHGVDTNDYHALLDYYCNPALVFSTPGDAQVTIGRKLLHVDPDWIR
ncbi:hypothetical protein TWF106_003531 [Orbilia oligospora]|uniref:Uncharacterized protein n=1 Tax=Orbilia oligospora TaxID=2813651 RepID=A0A7C8U553_ORBOL|nr:hypothetical protein TWF106_003531 [Orbilia oligospora]